MTNFEYIFQQVKKFHYSGWNDEELRKCVDLLPMLSRDEQLALYLRIPAIAVHQFRWYPFTRLVIYSIGGKVNTFFLNSRLSAQIFLTYALICRGMPRQSAHSGTHCTSQRRAADLPGWEPYGDLKKASSECTPEPPPLCYCNVNIWKR